MSAQKKETEPFLHNGYRYPAYHEQPLGDLLKAQDAFVTAFHRFCNEKGFEAAEYWISRDRLADALNRADRRLLYSKIYRDGMVLNELQRIAVLAYWSIHLHVVMPLHGGPLDGDLNICERFMMELMFDVVRFVRCKYKEPDKVFDEEFKTELLSTLKYRPLTIDSLIMLVEALAS